MTSRALEGIKVADFSWVVTGPLVTKALADHGATVVRVESELHPDITRTSGPYKDGKPGLNRSAFFTEYNSSKLSLALDLSLPGGLDVARMLVSWADIVVENFAPGVMEKLGLGYDELKTIKPDIIVLRTSMQGQTGPHATHPGYGTTLADLAGFGNLLGWPDGMPFTPYGAYTDFIAPAFGVSLLLAALSYRSRNGKGQCLDLSQFECAMEFLAPELLDYESNGRVACRNGNRDDMAAPHGVYRCSGDDRWCAVAVFNDSQWLGLCRITGHDEWAGDARFSTFMNRKKNEDELDRLLEKWTIERTVHEVVSLMQEAGVPSGAVLDPQDVLEDSQLAHRGYFWRLEHPEIGAHSSSASSYRLSLTPAEAQRPAPCLGEHTEYVCTQLLGMSDEQFVSYMSDGIFH